MAACFDYSHPLSPVDRAMERGPEIGDLARYHASPTDTAGEAVRVVERSYVWSPERHNTDGTHGRRLYDSSVVEDAAGRRYVVSDISLSPSLPGDRLPQR
jgi:hypothetical protein